MDLIALAAAKNYTNKVTAGFKNVELDGMNLIFTLLDDTKATVAIPTPADGKDGVSVKDLSIDTDGSLLCYMTDGTVIDAGYVPTVDPDLTNYYTKEEVDTFITGAESGMKMYYFKTIRNINQVTTSDMPTDTEWYQSIVDDFYAGKNPAIVIQDYNDNTYIFALSDRLNSGYLYNRNYILTDNGDLYRASIQIKVNTDTKKYTSKVVSFTKQKSFLATDNTAAYTPTENYHPATKKYVDDKVLDNTYMTFIGHYLSKEDLPSVGQASGTYIDPAYDYLYQTLQKGRRSYSSVYRDFAAKRAKYYLVMALPASSSSTTDKPFVLYTDYPEMVRVCFTSATSSIGSAFVLPHIIVTYDPEKPVYYAINSSRYEGTKATEALLEGGIQQITQNSVLCTWTNNYQGAGMRPTSACDYRIFDYCNFPELKLDTTVRAGYTPVWHNYDTYTETRIKKSIRDLTNNFIWNDGMTIMKGNENGDVSLVYSEAVANENEVATVGENYEIYRCYAGPEWKKVGGSEVDLTSYYTKEETDNQNVNSLDFYTVKGVNSLPSSGVANTLGSATSTIIANIRESAKRKRLAAFYDTTNCILWYPQYTLDSLAESATGLKLNYVGSGAGIAGLSGNSGSTQRSMGSTYLYVYVNIDEEGNITKSPDSYSPNIGMNSSQSYLSIWNTKAFTPTGDYHPATKKYVDDSVAAMRTPQSHDGEGMIGWYNTAIAGDNLTELYEVTPDMVRAVKAGDYISWPSRVQTRATENTICLYNMTYEVYNKDEGDYLETIDIKIGKSPDTIYTYVIVGDNVYKETF